MAEKNEMPWDKDMTPYDLPPMPWANIAMWSVGIGVTVGLALSGICVSAIQQEKKRQHDAHYYWTDKNRWE
jgi:hypothetical protein